MVTCQICQQVLPPGRADQRFCSGRCRMRHHRDQKVPRHADRQWRRRLDLQYPIFFRRSHDHQAPLLAGHDCWLPYHYWTPQLQGLNKLHALAYILTDFIDAQDCPGQTDRSEEGDQSELNDWASILLTKLDEMQRNLDQLGQSEGQLGQLLRRHWSRLETGQQTLREHVQRFALTHQGGEPYIADLSPAFQAHLGEWGMELNLLWLNLERQTR